MGERASPCPAWAKTQPAAPASDSLTSAAVVWALASAEPLGLLTDPKVLDQAVALPRAGILQTKRQPTTRPARPLLHALSHAASRQLRGGQQLEPVRTELSDPAWPTWP